MQPVYLFDLAFQRAEWLTTRQTAIADNVANAHTPNFRARDVEPFEASMKRADIAMRTTNPNHIASASVRSSKFDATVASTIGNGVSLEKELIKSGEVTRDYQLNASVVKSFHRMWMSSVRS